MKQNINGIENGWSLTMYVKWAGLVIHLEDGRSSVVDVNGRSLRCKQICFVDLGVVYETKDLSDC